MPNPSTPSLAEIMERAKANSNAPKDAPSTVDNKSTVKVDVSEPLPTDAPVSAPISTSTVPTGTDVNNVQVGNDPVVQKPLDTAPATPINNVQPGNEPAKVPTDKPEPGYSEVVKAPPKVSADSSTEKDDTGGSTHCRISLRDNPGMCFELTPGFNKYDAMVVYQTKYGIRHTENPFQVEYLSEEMLTAEDKETLKLTEGELE